MRTEWRLRALSTAGLIVSSFVPMLCSSTHAQAKPEKSDEPPEMQITEGGFLAIDTPKGWSASEAQDLRVSYPKAQT
jgi:hypothetical protein